MADPVEALILDLLEWIDVRAKPYPEVMDAWRTSCPRLPVWEDANDRGFVECRYQEGSGSVVTLTELGRRFLEDHRREASPGAEGEVGRSPRSGGRPAPAGSPGTDETEAIASRFFAAIARGDLDAVRELYAPQASIWHNVTGRSQTREENLALLRFFTGRVSELRYEVIARDCFPGGFVQRHVLHGILESGERIAAPVCLVVYVSEGRIERLFEYLDPAAVRAAFA